MACSECFEHYEQRPRKYGQIIIIFQQSPALISAGDYNILTMYKGMHDAGYYRQVVKIIPGVAGGNTQQDFTFDDQPDLRYARMLSMRFYTSDDLAYSQPAVVPVVAPQFVPNISFVFRTNDPDDLPMTGPNVPAGKKAGGADGRFTSTLDTIQWIPASDLHVSQAFGTPQASFVREAIFWRDRYIIWQTTHIKLALPLNNTTDVAIVLGCFYTFLNSKGEPIFPRN